MTPTSRIQSVKDPGLTSGCHLNNITMKLFPVSLSFSKNGTVGGGQGDCSKEMMQKALKAMFSWKREVVSKSYLF